MSIIVYESDDSKVVLEILGVKIRGKTTIIVKTKAIKFMDLYSPYSYELSVPVSTPHLLMAAVHTLSYNISIVSHQLTTRLGGVGEFTVDTNGNHAVISGQLQSTYQHGQIFYELSRLVRKNPDIVGYVYSYGDDVTSPRVCFELTRGQLSVVSIPIPAPPPEIPSSSLIDVANSTLNSKTLPSTPSDTPSESSLVLVKKHTSSLSSCIWRCFGIHDGF